MLCLSPVNHRFAAYVRFYCAHCFGEYGFGADKVYFAQEAVAWKDVSYLRPQLVGKFLEYSCHLAQFGATQLAYPVVGFHYFGRFDKHGAPCGRLVVYNAAYLAFQCRGNGYHQSSVAHGGGDVLVDVAFALCVLYYGAQAVRYAARGRFDVAAYAFELVRGVVLYFSVFVENLVNAFYYFWKYGHILGQPCQGRVSCIFAVFAVAFQESHYPAYGA